MTDRDMLAGAVAARFSDDAPRLVFADWLDEHGDSERATFIRLQCEASRYRPGHPRRLDRLHESDALIFQYEETWLGPIAEQLVNWTFARGFLQQATITANNFLEHGEAILRQEPIGNLTFVDDLGNALEPDVIREVVGHPAFGGVKGLTINIRRFSSDASSVNAWLESLASNERVTRLRAVHTDSSVDLLNQFSDRFGLDQRAFERFCRAGHLRSITSLHLNSCPIASPNNPEVLLSAIRSASFASRLRVLELTRSRLSPRDLDTVANDPVFSNLRRLNLLQQDASVPSLASLFDSRTLTKVTAWSLPGSDLLAFSRSPAARKLRALRVHPPSDFYQPCDADQLGWRELLKTARPPKVLEFHCNNPGDVIFDEMMRHNWLRRVHTLNLKSDSQFSVFDGTEVFQRMLSSNALPRLGILQTNELANRGLVAAIGAWPRLKNLEKLELSDDYYGRLLPEWLPPHAQLQSVRSLSTLQLKSDADVDLVATWNLGNLKQLSMAFTSRLSESGFARLFRLPQLSRVESMRCYDNTNSDQPTMAQPVMDQLADPSVMPRLRSLDIGMWSFEEANTQRLRPRFGPRLFAHIG